MLIPRNSGCYRPIRLIAPPGSVVNVLHPGPSVGGNTDLQPKLIDLLLDASRQAVPERVAAASGGSSSNLLFGGVHPETGRYYSNYHFDGMGAGGTARKDGNDGEITRHSNCRNTPVEVFEHRYPLLTLEYWLAPDSGGAGRAPRRPRDRSGRSASTPTRSRSARSSTAASIAPQGLFGGLPRPRLRAARPPGRRERVPPLRRGLRRRLADEVHERRPAPGRRAALPDARRRRLRRPARARPRARPARTSPRATSASRPRSATTESTPASERPLGRARAPVVRHEHGSVRRLRSHAPAPGVDVRRRRRGARLVWARVRRAVRELRAADLRRPCAKRAARKRRRVVDPGRDDRLSVHEDPLDARRAARDRGTFRGRRAARGRAARHRRTPRAAARPGPRGARGGPGARDPPRPLRSSGSSSSSREKRPRKRGIVPQNSGSGSDSSPFAGRPARCPSRGSRRAAARAAAAARRPARRRRSRR